MSCKQIPRRPVTKYHSDAATLLQNANLLLLHIAGTLPLETAVDPLCCLCWSCRFQVVICSYSLIHSAVTTVLVYALMPAALCICGVFFAYGGAEIISVYLYFQLRNDFAWICGTDTTLFAVMDFSVALCKYQGVFISCRVRLKWFFFKNVFLPRIFNVNALRCTDILFRSTYDRRVVKSI